MKKYLKPAVEVIKLQDVDIITCSDPFEEIEEDITW